MHFGCFWHKADIRRSAANGRFWGKSGHGAGPPPLRKGRSRETVRVLGGRACGVERAASLAPHFPRYALNRAGSDPAFSGNFENALTSPQMTQDSLFNGGSDLRPPQLLTLFYGPLKPGMDSLADH